MLGPDEVEFSLRKLGLEQVDDFDPFGDEPLLQRIIEDEGADGDIEADCAHLLGQIQHDELGTCEVFEVVSGQQ
ncbi:hypothetical protein D3C86_1149670 [compost metagenome]